MMRAEDGKLHSHLEWPNTTTKDDVANEIFTHNGTHVHKYIMKIA